MIHSVEVSLWGSSIGVAFERNGIVYFQYDPSFVDSQIEVSPFNMPLSNAVYSFPQLRTIDAFKGLPGLLADSLPDRFGNEIIKQWLISQGRSDTSFTPLEYLCYIGMRGMGALEYKPSNGPVLNDDILDITEISQLANQIVQNKSGVILNADDATKAQMIEIGSSVGGARSKATVAWNRKTKEIRSGQLNIGKDYEYWIVKFDDGKDHTPVEFAYYLMAKDLEINMKESFLLEKDGLRHFATKRFDRTEKGKLHMQTLGALLHLDYNIPNLCSYERYVNAAKKLGCEYNDIEQIFKRMVFSHKALNYDDHVKNFSFLMNKDGKWQLSPAYDLTYAYVPNNRWISRHQMSINGKTEDITDGDLLLFGAGIGIPRLKCKEIVEKTRSVVCEWRKYARIAGVGEEKTEQIMKEILAQDKKNRFFLDQSRGVQNKRMKLDVIIANTQKRHGTQQNTSIPDKNRNGSGDDAR